MIELTFDATRSERAPGLRVRRKWGRRKLRLLGSVESGKLAGSKKRQLLTMFINASSSRMTAILAEDLRTIRVDRTFTPSLGDCDVLVRATMGTR